MHIIIMSMTISVGSSFDASSFNPVRWRPTKPPRSALRSSSPRTSHDGNNVGDGRSTNKLQWIACSSTTEVTRAIERYVRPGDAVAELGSQLRESSTALCDAIGPTGRAVLVDIQRKFPNEKKGAERTTAMRREGDELGFYPDRAVFVETAGFAFWREALFLRLSHTDHLQEVPQYDVLVVDVSTVAGNDLDLTCISLANEFTALNQRSGDTNNRCRAIIVKSASLHDLARRLHHAQRVISGAQAIREHRHSSIVGAVGVKQYRDTIPFVVRKGDICVEVGCHLGTSTKLISDAATAEEGDDDGAASSLGGCLGVDVGPNIIKSARLKYPELTFEVGDGFHTGELARMRRNYFGEATSSRTFDVVYVDIGGLSGSEGLLEALSLLASISNSLAPRCIVIKSLCVRRLASCLVPFSEVWRNEILLMRQAESSQ